MSRISTRKISTDYGDLVYYRTLTEERDFDILFIHGLGGNKEWLNRHFTSFQLEGYSWIVPDLIGYGESSKPNSLEAYTMNNQAERLVQLLIEEKVESLIILAHSMGGPIAISLLEFLVQKPDLKINLFGLVYLEGNLDQNDAFFSSQISKYSRQKFENTFDSWLNTLSKDAKGWLKDFFQELRKIGPFPLWASSMDLVSVSTSNELFPRLKRVIQAYNIPIYFIFGEKNKGQFTSESLVKQSQLPLFYVPEAGHAMFDENPNAFWKIIKQIIGKIVA